MFNVAKFGAGLAVALVLSTSLAVAGPIVVNGDYSPIDIPAPQITPSPEVVDAINDAINPTIDPSGPVGDAINDAILGPKRVAGSHALVLALGCQIGNNGGLVLTNRGEDDYPAGTRVKWQVRSYGEQGYVTLRNGLDAGDTLRVKHAADEIDAGAACSAKAVNL